MANTKTKARMTNKQPPPQKRARNDETRSSSPTSTKKKPHISFRLSQQQLASSSSSTSEEEFQDDEGKSNGKGNGDGDQSHSKSRGKDIRNYIGKGNSNSAGDGDGDGNGNGKGVESTSSSSSDDDDSNGEGGGDGNGYIGGKKEEDTGEEGDTTAVHRSRSRGKTLHQSRGKTLTAQKLFMKNTMGEEDRQDSEEEEEMTKITGKVYTNVNIGILPSLQLHSSMPFSDDGHPPPPDTKALDLNCRHVDISRMTCRDPKDNMVKKLRGEEKNSTTPSVVVGMVHIVVTSYTLAEEELVQSSLPMKSVAFPEERALCHAIPCTVEILKTAIKYLEGKSGNQDTQEVTTVEEGLCSYLQLLGEKMPKDIDFSKLKAFIKDHDWSDDSWGLDKCLELIGETQNTADLQGPENGYFLQRFIHENLARETKIVAHFVDGIHRVTAMDFTLIGWCSPNDDDDATKARNNYCQCLPHQDVNIDMNTFIPAVIDEKLLQYMKRLSSEIQSMACSQVPHNVRDIIANEMTRLWKRCDDDKIPYLWDGLGVLYKVLGGKDVSEEDIKVMKNGIHRDSQAGRSLLDEMEELALFSPSKEHLSKCLDGYIQCWVENMAQIIIPLLKSSTHKIEFQTLSSPQDTDGDEIDVSAKKIFQKTLHSKTNEVPVQIYTIFQSKIDMQTKSFFQTSNDWVAVTGTVTSFKGVFKENRFAKKPHMDVIFVVCHFLLWSWTGKKLQSSLYKLFSGLQPTSIQYTPGSYDDAYRWIMILYQNLSDAVIASYPPWKTAFFIPDINHPIQCNPEQVIHLCLLGDALEKIAPFFAGLGMKPVWPQSGLDELHALLKSLLNEQEGYNTVPDLLSTIATSHTLRMSTMIDRNHPGEKPDSATRKKIERERLERLKGRGIARVRNSKYSSPLSKNTIHGNKTADPRLSITMDEETSIVIVSNNEEIDEEDEDTLFTADISQHFKLLSFQGHDTILKDYIDSIVDDGEEVTSDDDDEDEEESVVEEQKRKRKGTTEKSMKESRSRKGTGKERGKGKGKGEGNEIPNPNPNPNPVQGAEEMVDVRSESSTSYDLTTKVGLCLKMMKIICNLHETLKDEEECPGMECIGEILKIQSNIRHTPLQNAFAAVQARHNAAQQRTNLALTNIHDPDADQESSEESEEDDNNDTYRTSEFVHDEAEEAGKGSSDDQSAIDYGDPAGKGSGDDESAIDYGHPDDLSSTVDLGRQDHFLDEVNAGNDWVSDYFEDLLRNEGEELGRNNI